jgi:hypothetical protein
MIQCFRELYLGDRSNSAAAMPSLLYMLGRERGGTGPQSEDIASPHKKGPGIG